jgi:hypothetical protein
MTYQSENTLLHFTSAKNAALILGTSTINFGSLGNSNDLSENPRLLDSLALMCDAKPEGVAGDLLTRAQLVREIQSMGFICLSEFTAYKDNVTGDLLFHEPDKFELMMGHYASKGQGICLMFDKLKFIEELKYRGNDAEFHAIKHDKVKYENSGGVWDLSTISDYRDLASGENLGRLFIKREVWEYENEYRVLRVPHLKKPQSEIPLGVTFDKEALIGFAYCTLGYDAYPWTAEAQMYIDACKHSKYQPAEYEFSPYSREKKGGMEYIKMTKEGDRESSHCKCAQPNQALKGLRTVGC